MGSALNQYATSVPPGNITVTVTPTSITSGNVKYDFKNSWSFNGTPNATWTQAAQVVSVPSTGGSTYTANFDTSYRLNVVVNGNCTVNPQTGFYPSGSSQTVNVTLPSGSALGGITYTTSGSAGASVNNGGTITINGPGTLTVNCGQNPSVLINTNPTPIGVTVGLRGIGTGLNSYSNPSVAPGAAVLTATPAGPFLAADNYEYAFKRWRRRPLRPANVTIPSSGSVTYTAFYNITGFKVTVVNNGTRRPQ